MKYTVAQLSIIALTLLENAYGLYTCYSFWVGATLQVQLDVL